jgi:TolA-binding protein
MKRMLLLSALLLLSFLAATSFAEDYRSSGYNSSKTTARSEPKQRIRWEGAPAVTQTPTQRLYQLHQQLDSHKQRVVDQQRQKYLRERDQQRRKYLRERARRNRYRDTQPVSQQSQKQYKQEVPKQEWRRETAELKLKPVDPPQDSLFEADSTGDGLQPLRTYIQQAEPPL